MKYPGRIIKAGEQDANIVKSVKKQLNKVLVIDNDPSARLNPDDPNFGPKMTQLVKYFQARHVDAEGRPLRQDGEIGSLTWAALFGYETVSASDKATSELLAQVLVAASKEEAQHVREVPVNSNRGPEVQQYQKRAGASPGDPWCCAFVYWCFDEAANAMGCANPMVKTPGCLDHWQKAPARGAKRILSSAGIVFLAA